MVMFSYRSGTLEYAIIRRTTRLTHWMKWWAPATIRSLLIPSTCQSVPEYSGPPGILITTISISAVREPPSRNSPDGSEIPSQIPAAVCPLKSLHASSPPRSPSYTHHLVHRVIATAGSWTIASSPSHTLPILPRHLNAPALRALPIRCSDRTRKPLAREDCCGEGL